MSRFQLVSALSKNTMAALSANTPCYSTTTQNVIDKTKNAFPHAAAAAKQAVTSAKEKIEKIIPGSQGTRKANQKITNAEDIAKKDYVNAQDSVKIVSAGGGGDPAGNCGFVDTEILRSVPNAGSFIPHTGSTTPGIAHHR